MTKLENSERIKAIQQRRKDAGLCVGCGKRQPVTKVLCEECRQKSNERYKYRHALWLRQGKCSRCGGELNGDGFLTCPGCRQEQRLRWKIYHERKGAKAI